MRRVLCGVLADLFVDTWDASLFVFSTAMENTLNAHFISSDIFKSSLLGGQMEIYELLYS